MLVGRTGAVGSVFASLPAYFIHILIVGSHRRGLTKSEPLRRSHVSRGASAVAACFTVY